MKHLLATLTALAALCAPASASDYQPEGWRLAALEPVQAEQKVENAMWSQPESLWVQVADDGTSRDGFADYLCLVLSAAGRPDGEFVAISILDDAAVKAGQRREIGKAYCQ